MKAAIVKLKFKMGIRESTTKGWGKGRETITGGDGNQLRPGVGDNSVNIV